MGIQIQWKSELRWDAGHSDTMEVRAEAGCWAFRYNGSQSCSNKRLGGMLGIRIQWKSELRRDAGHSDTIRAEAGCWAFRYNGSQS